MYLDGDGKRLLQKDAESDSPVELEIRKSNAFAFYWHTRNTYDRISFRLTFVSLVLGLGIIEAIKALLVYLLR